MLMLAANIVIAIVAALHVGFFVLESFLWTTPSGLRIFAMTSERAEATASLAVNQGLYNAFLAAGLVWGLFAGADAFIVRVFFLSCVIIAGIVGAMTAKRSILWIQALPAAVALVLELLARG